MERVSTCIRLSKTMRDNLKANGCISGQIEQALLKCGYAPSIDNLLEEINKKKGEIEELKQGIRNQVYNVFLNKAKREIIQRYSEYVRDRNSKGYAPLSKEKYMEIELNKPELKNNINSITDKEMRKYESL